MSGDWGRDTRNICWSQQNILRMLRRHSPSRVIQEEV
jgi:hypothetical protein